ncbi:MAG: VTT domain-containing protein [Acidobacteria bacterium]|nr:VTT domain-containing protein [Acidobacteriota bacterium]
MFPHLPFPETQTTLALSIFLFTFAYEDGATLLAATLGAAGKLDVRLGFVSAFLGIWIGDMGLYALGSSLGRRAATARWSRRFISDETLVQAEVWFKKRGPLTVVMSRFLPGSRLPLYVTAGILKLPARLFSIITGICAAIWVAAIFGVWHYAPRLPWLTGRKAPGLLIAAFLLAPAFLSRGPALLKRVGLLIRKYQRWEFWPAWMFYPPVAAMCVWLGLRYRGFSLPTVANPAFRNGGVVGESKIEILQALMQVAPEAVADGCLIAAGNVAQRREAVDRLRSEQRIGYPFVLKPNVGQRGAGFKLMNCAADVDSYLTQVASDIILQRYVGDQKEIGVFYYRFPGQQRGQIFAITEKVFPAVVGDGMSTFEQLIDADPRASLISSTYSARFPDLRGRVLPTGKRVRLVEAGNHCQGCIFRDGSHLASEALRDRIDKISRRIPGFFIGRYDIRYSSDEDLLRGETFKIIELNGAASEATNIYDERNSLLTAYKTLYRQWKLVYSIGRKNRDLGHRPPSFIDFLKDWKLYQATSAAYPAAD